MSSCLCYSNSAKREEQSQEEQPLVFHAQAHRNPKGPEPKLWKSLLDIALGLSVSHHTTLSQVVDPHEFPDAQGAASKRTDGRT